MNAETELAVKQHIVVHDKGPNIERMSTNERHVTKKSENRTKRLLSEGLCEVESCMRI
jgi:hypothetical protein